MKNADPPPQPAPMNEGRLLALITLLGDEDPAVESQARHHLLSGGPGVLTMLRAHRLHPDPIARRRIQDILESSDRSAADEEFSTFIRKHGEHFDLEDAVWRFTRTTYPAEQPAAWSALFDDYADRIRNRTPGPIAGTRALQAINHLLFEELGLRGNEADYYNPENGYPHRVIERKLGIPISLCVIYLFIARRLHLPITGIGMPGHFLCRYQAAIEEHYVDAFHRGRLLTRLDCQQRLQNLAVAYDESYLLPITPRRILQRMVANLHVIHKERKDHAEAERLQRYVLALSS